MRPDPPPIVQVKHTIKWHSVPRMASPKTKLLAKVFGGTCLLFVGFAYVCWVELRSGDVAARTSNQEAVNDAGSEAHRSAVAYRQAAKIPSNYDAQSIVVVQSAGYMAYHMAGTAPGKTWHPVSPREWENLTNSIKKYHNDNSPAVIHFVGPIDLYSTNPDKDFQSDIYDQDKLIPLLKEAFLRGASMRLQSIDVSLNNERKRAGIPSKYDDHAVVILQGEDWGRPSNQFRWWTLVSPDRWEKFKTQLGLFDTYKRKAKDPRLSVIQYQGPLRRSGSMNVDAGFFRAYADSAQATRELKPTFLEGGALSQTSHRTGVSR